MAWEGIEIFFKIKTVSISWDVLLHFMNTKMYFDACRQRLHNSGFICNQATALIGLSIDTKLYNISCLLANSCCIKSSTVMLFDCHVILHSTDISH